MKISDLKVGDLVTYRVSGSREDTRTSVARVSKISLADNRVHLTRRDGNSVTHLILSPTRVVGVYLAF